jgi:hypothetical protein
MKLAYFSYRSATFDMKMYKRNKCVYPIYEPPVQQNSWNKQKSQVPIVCTHWVFSTSNLVFNTPARRQRFYYGGMASNTVSVHTVELMQRYTNNHIALDIAARRRERAEIAS